MIIVAGALHVDPAERDAYLSGCRRVIELARSAPGCLDFVLAADPVDAGRINVYERWESDEHLEAFRGGGPDAGQAAAIRDAHVSRYRIDAVEPA
ncbi:putative quinol monooxygenase [Thermomonospora amylolytica]|uniref:putative quinol monooxygenase n=1 Tax=Thermomonospora amylolytica TaxID=1411117 RepID=UPI000E6CC09A|nr:antibiotic biosynthesis monooxygenase family protein [Thermomonospora amylolytica]